MALRTDFVNYVVYATKHSIVDYDRRMWSV